MNFIVVDQQSSLEMTGNRRGLMGEFAALLGLGGIQCSTLAGSMLRHKGQDIKRPGD